MWKKEFDTSYVGFMKDGAQWLVDNTDIKLVGKLVPFRGSLVALQKMFLLNLEYLWPFVSTS
jgi:hypothetical protein